MATSSLNLLFCVMFISTIATSMASCSTRFTNNRVFDICSELPTLNASLHWTYTSNSNISIAFVAAPATSAGWVAWGINPNSLSMFGARALLAYRSSNGSLVAGTYNITNTNVVPSPIDYPVSGLSAEESGSNFVIFASLQLPAGVTATNHVWQVGPAMRSGAVQGLPAAHAMLAENLRAVGTIDFVRGTAGGPAISPTSPTSPVPPSTPGGPGGPGSAGFRTVAASLPLVFVGLLHLLH